VIFQKRLAPRTRATCARKASDLQQQPGQQNLGGKCLTIQSYGRRAWELGRIGSLRHAYRRSNRRAGIPALGRLHSPDPFRDSVRLRGRILVIGTALQAWEERIAIGSYQLSGISSPSGCSGRLTTLGRTLDDLTSGGDGSSDGVLDFARHPMADPKR